MPFLSLEQRILQEDRKALEKAKKKAKIQRTNLIARQHGLKEPDRPEAIQFDDTHCVSCGDRLHDSKAHEQLDVDYLKVLEKMGQNKVNTLCCSCFGRMQQNGKVIQKVKKPDSDTFKQVYDPLKAPKYSGKRHVPKSNAVVNIKKSDDVSQELSMDMMFLGAYSTRYG